MAIVRIVQPPNVTADVYDKVNAEMGVADDTPAGLLFHCAGEVDGRWQIIDAWESEEHVRLRGGAAGARYPGPHGHAPSPTTPDDRVPAAHCDQGLIS